MNFRCHVSFFGTLVVGGSRGGADISSKTEVTDFKGCFRTWFLEHEDVLEFDVAVGNPLTMKIGESCSYLSEGLSPLADVNKLEMLKESASVGVL